MDLVKLNKWGEAIFPHVEDELETFQDHIRVDALTATWGRPKESLASALHINRCWMQHSHKAITQNFTSSRLWPPSAEGLHMTLGRSQWWSPPQKDLPLYYEFPEAVPPVVSGRCMPQKGSIQIVNQHTTFTWDMTLSFFSIDSIFFPPDQLSPTNFFGHTIGIRKIYPNI